MALYSFMASTFFSTASIGSVSTVILFLMTFLPYIIIISLGAVLSSLGKFIASLSLSTAFCYAWHHIFRTELQEKNLTLFDDDDDNDFRFGVLMIIFDTFLYAAIGFINKRFSSGEFNGYFFIQIHIFTKIFIYPQMSRTSAKSREKTLAKNLARR